MRARRDAIGRRLCARCDALARWSSYCLAHKRIVDQQCRERRRLGMTREFHRESADFSTPPPPPPGFDARDLINGKPIL